MIGSYTKLVTVSKLLKEFAAAFLLTGSVYCFFPDLLDSLAPGAFVRDAYADLLGFAIGVYALFFVIPERLIILIERNKRLIGFGPEIIAAEMFYPLVILTTSWAVCFFLAPFEELKFVLGIELFLATYGFLLILELLGGIYAGQERDHILSSYDLFKILGIHSRNTLFASDAGFLRFFPF